MFENNNEENDAMGEFNCQIMKDELSLDVPAAHSLLS